MPPEPERDFGYVWDMLDAARHALEFVRGASFDDYLRNRMLRDAVQHEPLVMGEAANRVSDPFRVAHAEIPWRTIVGLRNVVAHQYDAIDHDIIWKIATADVPDLIRRLEPLTPPAPEG